MLTGSPLGPGTPLIPAGPRSPCKETKKIQNTKKYNAGRRNNRQKSVWMCCCFYLHSRGPDLTYGSSLTGIALKTVTRSVFYLNNDEAGRQRSFRDRYSHGLPGFPEDRRHQAFHEDPVCKEGTLLLINFNLITEMQFHLVTGSPGKNGQQNV